MAEGLTALLRRLGRRAASGDGFGLVEMLIALTILTVAIGALVTAFAASAVSLRRAGQKGTALTLADTRMEKYRTKTYTGVRIGDVTQFELSESYVTAHSADSTIPASTGQATAGQNGDDTCPPPSSAPVACLPVQTVPGPDGHSYRIETYVNYVNNDATLSVMTPASGLPLTLKRVTIVVRDDATGQIMAREQSAFHGP